MIGTLFTSQKNYLKNAQPNTFQVTVGKPATYDPDQGVYYTDTVIPSPVGILPITRVWYDPNSDGQRVPAFGRYDYSSAISDYCDLGDVPFDLLIYSMNSSSITLRTVARAPLAGTCNVYYKVYLDPTA